MSIGIAAQQGGPLNVMRSLAAWVGGTTGAAYPASAACVRDTDGTLKRWNEIYAQSPAPEARYVGMPVVDPYQLLREVGSPLLMFDLPAPGTDALQFGEAVSIEELRITLSLFCAVYTDASSGDLDGPRTTQQYLNAIDKLKRLLRWRGGTFPIYDFAQTPAQEHRVGFGQLDPLLAPTERPEQLRCDFALRVRFLRGAG